MASNGKKKLSNQNFNSKHNRSRKQEVEKGILGVPKSQMFFRLGGKETWPSDSEDEDYVQPQRPDGVLSFPSDDSDAAATPTVSAKQRRKRKAILIIDSSDSDSEEASTSASKTRKVQQPKKTKRLKHGSKSEKSTTHTRPTKLNTASLKNGSRLLTLPVPVLVHILSYVVAEQGPVPFLNQVKTLSNQWNEASSDPVLWKRVDLSSGTLTDKLTARRVKAWVKYFQSVPKASWESLNLTGWKLLQSVTFKQLVSGCAKLRSITLSDCKGLTGSDVLEMCGECAELQEIDLTRGPLDVIKFHNLTAVIGALGSRLTSLNLSFNVLQKHNTLMNVIYKNCCRLEMLDLSTTPAAAAAVDLPVNVSEFQRSCLGLRALRFVNVRIRPVGSLVNTPGFPALQELSIPYGHNSLYTDNMQGKQDDTLHGLLGRSEGLKLLDLRGRRDVSFERLATLPATGLRQLLLCNYKKSDYGSRCEINLPLLTSKWCETLEEVDVGRWSCMLEDVSRLVETLGSAPDSRLAEINLAETPITETDVRLLVTKCPRLRVLDLTSCRNLPRGCKSRYEGTRLQSFVRSLLA